MQHRPPGRSAGLEKVSLVQRSATKMCAVGRKRVRRGAQGEVLPRHNVRLAVVYGANLDPNGVRHNGRGYVAM